MIYLIRHGQTAGNKAHKLQGRAEIPLNETGREQARTAARWFKERQIRFDLVYSSPLGRAIETAGIIAADANIRIDQRLIEMEYGPYEGMDLKEPRPEVLRFFSDFVNIPEPEGMEPLAEIVKRTGDFLEEIRPLAKKNTILISTHAIALKGALEYLTPESKGSYWSKYVANCEIYQTELKDGEYTVPVKAAGQFV